MAGGEAGHSFSRMWIWSILTAGALAAIAIRMAFESARQGGAPGLVDAVLEKVDAPVEATEWMLPDYPPDKQRGCLIELLLPAAAIGFAIKAGAGWWSLAYLVGAFLAGAIIGSYASTPRGSIVATLADFAHNARQAAARLASEGQREHAAQAHAVADWIMRLVREVPSLDAGTLDDYYTVHEVVRILESHKEGADDYDINKWLERPMVPYYASADEDERVRVLHRAQQGIQNNQGGPEGYDAVLNELRAELPGTAPRP